MSDSWKDATSYRRGQERTPTWWEIEGSSWKVSVGNRHVHMDPCPWILSAWVVPMDLHVIGPVDDLTEAEAKAVGAQTVANRLRRMADEIEEAAGLENNND